MKPPPFQLVLARSAGEAVAALAEAGDDAKPIAGGQSLVPALNMRLLRPTVLVDITRCDLDKIHVDGGQTVVGATVTQSTLQRSVHVPRLVAEALPYIGHVATRNRGTVGGSIAHADAAAELCTCLVACAGTVRTDRRRIPADDFFLAPFTTALEPGELILATEWPPDDGNVAFEELALRRGDFALAMVAVARGRVVVGSVGPAPFRLGEVEKLIAGETVTAGLAEEAGHLATTLVDPPASIHASARYLRELTGVLVRRALERAA
ncbi:MAG: FAD binding domain-containing protein [Gaiella sp.]